MESGVGQAMLSIVMIAAFLLIAGGIVIAKRGETKKGILMLIAALVLVGNVLIWTI